MSSKFDVVFVLGPPGSGKGTQCAQIVKNFGYTHLSAGDLLREERVKPGSEFGDQIENHIRNGTIVPVEITCRLLDNAMQAHGNKKFLIDGFPRNQDNLEGWNQCMAEKVNLQFVLFLECPRDTCIERIMERSKQSGRSDDNMESLVKRFDTYINATMPIIEHYSALNLVQRADSTKDPDGVFQEIKAFFGAE